MSERVKPDGYNTPVPAKILTPDRVETRIGTLEFADGFPSEATSQGNWIQTVPRQELVRHPAALRPPRAMVRQDMGPWRHRTNRS